MRTEKLTRCAILAGIGIAVHTLESLIPIPLPVPGLKLGLANIVTLFSIYTLPLPESIAVICIRVLLGNLLTGSLSSAIYAFCGAGAAFVVMLALKKVLPEKAVWLVSVLGSVAHNAGQIGCAALLTKTPGIWAYLPVLVFSGCLTGAFTGIIAGYVLKKKAIFTKKHTEYRK